MNSRNFSIHSNMAIVKSINETLSNYSASNIAYNAGTIDASVSAIAEGTQTAVNNSITTTAIGAVNSGSITVTVK